MYVCASTVFAFPERVATHTLNDGDDDDDET